MKLKISAFLIATASMASAQDGPQYIIASEMPETFIGFVDPARDFCSDGTTARLLGGAVLESAVKDGALVVDDTRRAVKLMRGQGEVVVTAAESGPIDFDQMTAPDYRPIRIAQVRAVLANPCGDREAVPIDAINGHGSLGEWLAALY